jgi:myo-inositol-1-phosphate synthase
VRTGVWLIGARGSVAVTSMVGAFAIRAGLIEPFGCVIELPELRSPAVPGLGDLVFGGHDVTPLPLAKKAEALAAAGVVPARLVAAVSDVLAAVEAELRPTPEAATQGGVAARVAEDVAAFARRLRLDRVVVVNVSSTEPAAVPHPAHADLAQLRHVLRSPVRVLPTSSV